MFGKEGESKKVTKPQGGEVAKKSAADLFNLKDNMEGVEARLPRIKIIHQGQLFLMPDESKVQSFTGIILDQCCANAWWKKSYDEGGSGNPPDCFSPDGIAPKFCDSPQAESCAKCEKNEYETAEKGKGKACKNTKRVHILMDGQLLPLRLTLPPSNLRQIDTYISLLTSRAIPYQIAVTEFTLTKAQNNDGIEFSLLGFHTKKVLDLNNEEEAARAVEIKETRDQWLRIMRDTVVTSDDV